MGSKSKMRFVKMDINKHDLNKVAELMYETDSETYNFYFKNQQSTVQRIKRLIIAGDSSWSHENIYIVTESNSRVLGVLVAYKGEEAHKRSDFKAYFKNLNFFDAVKFVFLDIGDTLLGADLDEDDYYLSDLAVDGKCRGKGIGTFILERSLELARERGCKRVVLDVYLDNESALRLYKRVGFKIFNKKSIRWFGGEKRVYNMEYKLF